MRRLNVLVAATLAALIAAPVQAAVEVKPYGFVETVINKSFRRGNRIENPNVATSGNATSPNSNPSDIDTRGTRFGMKLSGGKGPMDADLSGVVEMDFNGSPASTGAGSTQPQPRLRLAYVQVAKGMNKFIIGQDWMNALVPINPFSVVRVAQGLGTSSGRLYNRLPQIRWDADWLQGGDLGLMTRVAALRAYAGNESTTGVGTQEGSGDASGVPMFQANVEAKYKLMGQNFRVGVGGQYRRDKWDSVVTVPGSATSNVADELLGVAYFTLPIHSMFEIDGSGFYGRGENSSIGAISKFINDNGRPRDALSRGGWIQGVLKPMAGWRVLGFYGVTDVDTANEANSTAAAAVVHRNTEMMASVVWDVSPELALSVEGGHVNTTFVDAAHSGAAGTAAGHFDSVGAAAQYKF